MALNENYSGTNNNQKNNNGVTVYATAYKMSNIEDSIDPSTISFTFWQQSLKISIAPRKQGVEQVQFDYEHAISIFLNHTKARILKQELENFLRDPKGYNSSGVPSGQAIITISNGEEFGLIDRPCLVIRKVDETGSPVSSYAYQFKDNYYYSVRNYDAEKKSFDKAFDDYKYLEIIQLITFLEEYYKAMTGAVAFSVLDTFRFEHARMNNKIDQVAAKLGVQFSKPGRSGGNSFFNQQSGGSSSDSSSGSGYTSGTIDDLDNL